MAKQRFKGFQSGMSFRRLKKVLKRHRLLQISKLARADGKRQYKKEYNYD